jgi:hypothetical protein
VVQCRRSGTMPASGLRATTDPLGTAWAGEQHAPCMNTFRGWIGVSARVVRAVRVLLVLRAVVRV